MLGNLKLGLIAGTLVVGGFFAWKHEHDKRIRIQAAASARFARDSANLASFRDSLNRFRIRAETSSVKVARTIFTYDTLRRQVVLADTTRYVLVDTAFVRSADSVRDACHELESDCAVYRKWADSTITTQERMIADAGKRECPVTYVTIWQKTKYGSVGAVIGGAAGFLYGYSLGEKNAEKRARRAGDLDVGVRIESVFR